MILTKTTQVEVPIGLFLVRFETIWGTPCNEGKHDDCLEHGCLDNEPSYIAEVDGSLTEVTLENWQELGVEGLTLNSNPKLWVDDTHDLRDKVFATKEEANKHLEYTLNRFKNPQPWEAFVKTA